MFIESDQIKRFGHPTIYGFAGLLIGATVGYIGVLAIVIVWAGYNYIPSPPPKKIVWWPW